MASQQLRIANAACTVNWLHYLGSFYPVQCWKHFLLLLGCPLAEEAVAKVWAVAEPLLAPRPEAVEQWVEGAAAAVPQPRQVHCLKLLAAGVEQAVDYLQLHSRPTPACAAGCQGRPGWWGRGRQLRCHRQPAHGQHCG